MWSEEWGVHIWVAVKGQLKKGGKGKGSKGKAREKGKNKKRARDNAEERTRRRKGKGKHRGEEGHGPPSREDPLEEDVESVEVDEETEGDDDGDGSEDEDGGGEGEEWPEEETMTYDPSIDVTPRPDVEVPAAPPRLPEVRRNEPIPQRPGGSPPRGSPAGSGGGSSGGGPNGSPAGSQPQKKKPGSESSSHTWDERKGPAPGIRWRGGKPPDPPAYEHNPRDLRSFPRWERRVRLWQRRVSQWLTPGEAGLFLLESLTGQAELETEHVSLDRAAQADGVDYLLSTLRNPLGEKSLYLKRLYLQEWENIGRQQNESVRSYLNRFRRVMLDLQSQEVGLESAFSSESVGFRLLERCRLAPDQQRVVLVGSNQSFQYEPIRESMLLQFPEGKAPPPLYGVPNQQRQPPNQQMNPKGGKSSGKFHRPRAVAVHAAEHEEDHNDPAEEEQAEEDDYNEEEDEDVDHLAEELQEALTVTADKLKAITQGRRFNKPPKGAGKGKSSSSKSSSDKPPDKSRDRCRICNQLGHWHKECPNNKGTGKGGKPSGQRTVHVAEELVEEEENQHDSFFVYMVSREEPGKTIYRAPEVYLASAKSSGGYMITDTACQRLCHGKGWLEQHEGLLFQSLGLRTSRIEGQETFKFGAGKPQVSTSQVRIPVELGGQSVVLYSSELDLGIPLLGSLTLLDFLGATICLPKGIVYFERLGVSVPLVRLDNGHAAVEILPLVDRFRKSHMWPKGSKEIALNPDQENQRKDSQLEVALLNQGGHTHPLSLPSTEVCFGSSNASRPLELPSKVWSADHVSPTATGTGRDIGGLEKSGPKVGVPTNGPPPVMCKVNEAGATGSTNDSDHAALKVDKRPKASDVADILYQPAVLPPMVKCRHENVKRSGNRHGSYAVCQNPACNLKMRFDPDAKVWREFYSQSQRQLPHPSQAPIGPALGSSSAPSHGYGATPKSSPPHPLPQPKRRNKPPSEFDISSVVSQMTWDEEDVTALEEFQDLDASRPWA